MASKQEGPAFRPLPLARGGALREAAGRAARAAREPEDPRCQMCGSPAIAGDCKRICLKCGFMTGCSGGI